MSRSGTSLQGVCGIVVSWVRRDAITEPRVWFVSCSAIIICVAAVTLLYTAVAHTSLVFLQLAESQVGEADLVMLPAAGASLNATALRPLLAGAVAGMAPRWLLAAQTAKQRPAETMKTTTALEYVVSEGSAVRVVVYDSHLEQRLGVSRQWPYPALDDGQCHASSSLLTLLGTVPGETISVLPDLDLPMRLALKAVGGDQAAVKSRFCDYLPRKMCDCLALVPLVSANFTAQMVEAIPHLEVCTGYPLSPLLDLLVYPCTVVSAVPKPYGKWPSALGNVIALDSKAVENHIAAKLNPLIALMAPSMPRWEPSQRSPLWENAMSINLYMADRLEEYSGSEESLKLAIRTFSDTVATTIGITFRGELTAPVYESPEAYLYGRLLFKNLALLLVAFLLILASLLLLSLLTSSVEEKSYEFGLLRAMGLARQSLAAMLTMRSGSLAVPAAGLGLLLAFLGYMPMALQISSYTGTPFNPGLDPQAVVGALVFSLVLPLITNIPATRRATGQSLREATN